MIVKASIRKLKDVLEAMEKNLLDQTTAVNVYRQSLREMMSKIDELKAELLSLDTEQESENRTADTTDTPVPVNKFVRTYQNPEMSTIPNGLGSAAREPASFGPETGLLQGKGVCAPEDDGSAPTTRLQPLSPEAQFVHGLTAKLRKTHPKWILEEHKDGSRCLTYDALTVAMYAETPVRVVIFARRKETRRLLAAISRLNQIQDSMFFGYDHGCMTCTLYFSPEMDLDVAASYCDAAVRNHFRDDCHE